MSNPLATRREGNCFHFAVTLADPADAPADAAKLSEAVRPFLVEMRAEPAAANAIHTALEELLTNLGKFGRTGDDPPPASDKLAAEGSIRVDAGTIELQLRDNGAAFDPTRYPPPVFTDDPDKLVPGGMGLHMLKTMFTAFSHRREAGKNIGVWTIQLRE